MEYTSSQAISYTKEGTNTSVVHNTDTVLERFTSEVKTWSGLDFELGEDVRQDGLQLIGPGRYLVSNCIFDREGKDPTLYDELCSSIAGAEVLWYRCQFKHSGKGILIGNGDHDEYDLNVCARNIILECEFNNVSRRNPFSKVGQTLVLSSRIRNHGSDACYYTKSHGSRAGYASQLMIVDTIYEQDDFWTCLKRKNAIKDMYSHEMWPPHKAMFIPGWMRAAYADRYGHVYAYKCHTNRPWLYLENHHGKMSDDRHRELSAHLDSLFPQK